MKWIKYEIHTTTADADSLGMVLTECGIEGYEITDHVPLTEKEEKAMFTDIPADMGTDDGTSVLTFYTEAPENEEKTSYSTGSSLRDAKRKREEIYPPEVWVEKILEKVEEYRMFFPMEKPEIFYQTEDDSLWKDRWKENFKPFYVAENILIKPSWEVLPADCKKEDIVIEIDPGSAFGSGTHETTRLCLALLKKYMTADAAVMDAGCGSGILAIASVFCGAESVLCLDVDALAVAGTRENAAKNHISPEKLKAVQANILEEADSLKKDYEKKFDIVVANILADVIIPLSGLIGDFIKKGGCFISSGILEERSDEVEEALKRSGFEVAEKSVLGEWCAFAAKQVDTLD